MEEKKSWEKSSDCKDKGPTCMHEGMGSDP